MGNSDILLCVRPANERWRYIVHIIILGMLLVFDHDIKPHKPDLKLEHWLLVTKQLKLKPGAKQKLQDESYKHSYISPSRFD